MDENQKPTNAPEQTRDTLRKVSQTNNLIAAVKTSIGGVVAIILLLVGAVYFAVSQAEYMLSAILAFMALVIGFVVWQTARLAAKKFSHNTAETPFEGTGTIHTETVQSYPRATLSGDEEIVGWLGPLQRYDFKGMSSVGPLGTETHRGAENTLLVTPRQLIAVAIVQSDFDTLISQGAANPVFSQLGAANSSAAGQHVQTGLLNFKLWPKLIDSIPATEYASLLDTHYQWGIPFADIQSVEVKNSAMNAGVQIHLTNGTTLKYSTFLKEQIQPFAHAAQAAGLNVIGM